MTEIEKLRRDLAEIEAATEAEKPMQSLILSGLHSRTENIVQAIKSGLAGCRQGGDNG